MNKTLPNQQVQEYILRLQEGDERGLDFFYRRFYNYLCMRSTRATQDECDGQSIAQEAFLRLWLFRKHIQSEEEVFSFLKNQVKAAIQMYFNKSKNRFHRRLLQLDSIEDYQEFMLGYEVEEQQEEDIVYLEQMEQEKQSRLDQLNSLLPSLNEQQQLFVKLCLKYSFNYERIAYYLGGISDYEVSLQVEKVIDTLRAVFSNAQKLEVLNKPSKIVLEGEFNEQQAEIFHMRYSLQLSFEQISEALHLTTTAVQKLFVQAHLKMKNAKKTA